MKLFNPDPEIDPIVADSVSMESVGEESNETLESGEIPNEETIEGSPDDKTPDARSQKSKSIGQSSQKSVDTRSQKSNSLEKTPDARSLKSNHSQSKKSSTPSLGNKSRKSSKKSL